MQQLQKLKGLVGKNPMKNPKKHRQSSMTKGREEVSLKQSASNSLNCNKEGYKYSVSRSKIIGFDDTSVANLLGQLG